MDSLYFSENDLSCTLLANTSGECLVCLHFTGQGSSHTVLAFYDECSGRGQMISSYGLDRKEMPAMYDIDLLVLLVCN